ncbi:MAG: AraC family transcriptional regulator [Spirochaetes bacterium]|nr:AraC family transcriptional regulator [Spirochaetota bacterium]
MKSHATFRSGASVRMTREEIVLPGLVMFGMHRYSTANTPIPEHTHQGAIEICYLSSGRQIIEVNDECYEMRGNDVLITPPGAPHSSSDQPAEKCALYYLTIEQKPPLLGFDPMDAKDILKALRTSERVCFQGYPRMKTLLDDACAALIDHVPFYRSVIMNRFMEFILDVVAAGNNREQNPVSAAVSHAMRYIDEHRDEAIDTADIAAAAGVSVPQIKRLFSAEVGIPPKEFILRRKIDRAKEMLAARHTAVTDIALALGFSSSQHFATIFKRYAGITPVDFRAQQKKKI